MIAQESNMIMYICNNKMKTESNSLKNNYQAKAEYNGINPVVVHDSSWTFQVPKPYMNLTQEIYVIVHEFKNPNKMPLMYRISILRLLLVSTCWSKSGFVTAFQPPAPIWIQQPCIQTKNPLRSYLQRSEQTPF